MRSRFENVELPKVDLITASSSLPFCNPKYFDIVLLKIVEAINIGGRFSDNFFGNNDGWTFDKKMTFLTKEQIDKMFERFDIEYFEETQEDKITALGEAVHRHKFDVIAKKIS